ncbi:MAG: hypothetical protein ACOVVK_24200 [Elsteraceae bacterium]
MTADIYLVEVDARLDVAGSVATLRFASGPGYNHPSAPGYYEPRLANPLTLRRTLFSAGATSGAVGVGTGAIDLANLDGGLDALIGYGFDGGRATVRTLRPDQPYGAARIMAVLTLEQPELTWTKASLRLRDRLQELETRRLQPRRYEGSNQGAEGVEGGAADLKGRPKPLAYGRVRNAAPPCVNAARLIYQLNDGAVAEAQAYDRGAALNQQPDYADRAEMEATAPSPGAFRLWRAGGYLRLGSPPTGLLTADILVGTAAERTAAALLAAMAIGPGGLNPADVAQEDVDALRLANSAELGLWVDAETSVRAAMEQVANSIGAWFGFDRLGRLRMGRLEAPAGPPAAVLTRLSAAAATGAPGDILSIERRPTDEPGRGAPCAGVRLTYQRNWSVQDTDLAGVVSSARRAFLGQATRVAIAEDPSIRLQFPGAIQRDFDSLIDDPAAAQAECERRLALRRARRDRLVARVRLDPDLLATVDLGAVIQLTLPRFGLLPGKLFVVIGLDLDAAAGVLDIDLWG